jgi:hypothetical protein
VGRVEYKAAVTGWPRRIEEVSARDSRIIP